MTEKERIAADLLVLRCRRGDSNAIIELVETWERRLFYFSPGRAGRVGHSSGNLGERPQRDWQDPESRESFGVALYHRPEPGHGPLPGILLASRNG